MNRALTTWLPSYLARSRRWVPAACTDILFCLCDHFEPFHGTTAPGARERLRRWALDYPTLARDFKDADGRHPRPTFFYPIEQYDQGAVQSLADLAHAGWGEVELHLHHERDTAETLSCTLLAGVERLARHGLLARDSLGKIRYAFVHGNWALDNSHPDGRHCGVNTELAVLKNTGCYADFTLPSAPDPTQTRLINSLYYAADTPTPKSHDQGEPVRVKSTGCRTAGEDPRLLLVQGPLGLNWRRRKWGCLPRIENGELAGNNPPSETRLRLWLDLHIHVRGRPEWVFVKLHTHGCDEERGNMAMLLGEPMKTFYQLLTRAYNDGRTYRLHFVTAREMVNILHAAEDGHTGSPGLYRDYRYQWKPAP